MFTPTHTFLNSVPFDVNTDGDDILPRPRFMQWGIRGLNRTKYTSEPYRYFVMRFPIWWAFENKYSGTITVHPDGRITYEHRWMNLCLLYTTNGFPHRLRFFWDTVGNLDKDSF